MSLQVELNLLRTEVNAGSIARLLSALKTLVIEKRIPRAIISRALQLMEYAGQWNDIAVHAYKMAVLEYEQVINSQPITSDAAYDALMGRQELQRIVELEHGINDGETTQDITKGRMQYIHVVNEYVEPKSDDPYLNESFRRFDLLNDKADDIHNTWWK